MLFNSLEFLIFFPVVTLVYFACPHRFRWFWLLVTSYYFYMCWEPRYALLMGASTLITYGTAWGIHASDGPWKRAYFLLSLISNLSILFFFKYYGFFAESAASLLHAMGIEGTLPTLKVLLPVGISFYTFQALSYSFDSYRGKIPLERHLGYYALYVSFFPQLVAGPIERSTHLISQLRNPTPLTYDRWRTGLLLMAWGFYKKLVVADRVAPIVGHIYNAPEAFPSTAHILATLLFSAQIYCDFSGYSDIATGAARIMGVDLMTNFARPYLSKSVGEFWSRWHISLSTWFRDYLYIPLGGNRCGNRRWRANLLIVFVISGLWHGADWTFAVWGALNGLYLVAETWIKGRRMQAGSVDRLSWWRIALTFGLTNFAWIFFRANSVHDAVYIVSRLPTGLGDLASNAFDPSFWRGLVPQMGSSYVEFPLIGIVLAVLFVTDLALERSDVRHRFLGMPTWVRWTAYFSLLSLILLFGVFSSEQFIYFQF